MKVAMMPDYRAGNPYQSMLDEALGRIDVNVFFPPGYRRIFPLWRAVSGNSADVLHLHWLAPYLKGSNFVLNALYAVKFCCDLCLVRLAGIRIVWTIHNQISHESRFPYIESFVQKFVSRCAGRMIVHSEAARRSMIRTGMNLDSARVSVIPHGHYGSAYSKPVNAAHARQALGWEAGKMVFLYFGMVRPYKNLEGLIGAWRSSPLLSTHAVLVVAGEAADPDYRRLISSIAAETPGLNLQLQRIPDEQVHLYFSACDVVVLPFNRILTSGSLLLAMSFGKPVIAPRLETVTETLLGAADLVYDSAEADGLRKTMEFAASSQADLPGLARRMQLLCAELNWDRIALLTKSAYKSCPQNTLN